MNNLDILISIFSDALSINPSEVSESLSYGDTSWDSVAHMVIIAALETAFDIMIDTEDVIDMSSVAKAKSIVEKYGVDLGA
ncbi:acyl carrier protein [Geomonas anaerohicana]|uniref:Acyl carrier protein n=1 Tax=Geomonas anaerohicana TaxID=2798583 RepID=A0ABS0YCK3_9BACT|nr:acyl carrier protein [Geomonas anaerohicana]MBJ6749864.1 acyl carrier protein [Geomonas anaerohicana]